jgi:hypothetical protein
VLLLWLFSFAGEIFDWMPDETEQEQCGCNFVLMVSPLTNTFLNLLLL